MGSGSVESGIDDIAKMEGLMTANKVSRSTTFCWPIYSVNPRLFEHIVSNGYVFSRGGHERVYRPLVDNPLDAPSFTFHDERLRGNQNSFVDAAKMAAGGWRSISSNEKSIRPFTHINERI